MRREFQVWILALLLVAAGGTLTYYKNTILGFPLLPDRSAEVWTVEATLTFEAGTNLDFASVEAAQPWLSQHREAFVLSVEQGFALGRALNRIRVGNRA